MERNVAVTHPLIISASGIRGIVGHTMTPEITSRYGAAFGAFLRDRAGNGGVTGATCWLAAIPGLPVHSWPMPLRRDSAQREWMSG